MCIYIYTASNQNFFYVVTWRNTCLNSINFRTWSRKRETLLIINNSMQNQIFIYRNRKEVFVPKKANLVDHKKKRQIFNWNQPIKIQHYIFCDKTTVLDSQLTLFLLHTSLWYLYENFLIEYPVGFRLSHDMIPCYCRKLAKMDADWSLNWSCENAYQLPPTTH